MILRKEVSKMTWSVDSVAMRECFAVPAMIPGVEGFVGKVIVRSRSIDVVRIER